MQRLLCILIVGGSVLLSGCGGKPSKLGGLPQRIKAAAGLDGADYQKAQPAPAPRVASLPPAPSQDSSGNLQPQPPPAEQPAGAPQALPAARPAGPTPPPEIPAEVRAQLELAGARIHDKPNGYAVDIRQRPGFTDAEIELVLACPAVVDLTLEGVSITDEGLKKLEKLPDVTRLILNDCPITSAGLETLATLPLHKKLFSIGLRGTKIADDDLKLFAKFPRLQRLDLSQTAVTDEGIAALQQLPLGYLNVAQTAITDGGLEQLQRRKPKLQIKR